MPIAILIPAPRLVVRRAMAIGLFLFACSTALLVTGAFVIVTQTNAYPGIALILLSVSVFMLMLWTAGSPRRKPPDDDADNGGGGGRGPKTPPREPGPPDGLGIDWDDFDRVRGEWGRDREPVYS